MISGDFDFRGFDATAWERLLSVLREVVHGSFGGTLIITVDHQGAVIGALHTVAGRIDHVDQIDDLSELCDQHDARRCVVLDERVLTEIAERASLRIDPEDDYAGQWLTVIRAAREMRSEGRLRFWPDTLSSWPLPSPQILNLVENLVLPNDRTLVFALFEDRELWTAAALRRRNDVIDLLAGPDEITEWVGPLGGDWRRDSRVFCRALEQHVAPVHVGVFSEPATLRQLLADDTPGRWAAAVTRRDIVVYPAPPWLGLALSLDGLRGMASSWLQLLLGLDPDEARQYLQGVLRGFMEAGPPDEPPSGDP